MTGSPATSPARPSAGPLTPAVPSSTREVLRRSISFQRSQDCGAPAYLQLAQQVKQAIRMGVLDVGDKLPTVKGMAVKTTLVKTLSCAAMS